ncbi:AsmA family protein [Oscillatoria amoena NRMC-F 0135]|nr:AsmA family protein [Oscillatoria amoena NRMC-F 0135]
MKKAFKIIGYLVLGFVGLVLLGIVSIYIFSKPIKDKVTQSISSQLAVKVAISDIGLSAFKNFPYITVSFQNIRAAESSKITGSQLMTLQSLSVTLNPLNLIRGQYRFEEIVLQNGKLKAAQDGEKK